MARQRIYINGRFLVQPVTGVQRYAREVLACLDESLVHLPDDGLDWTLLAPTKAPLPALRRVATAHVGRLQGHAWEQIDLAWHARDGLLVSFGFTGPLLKRRQVITVHDAAVIRMPQVYSWAFRLWYRATVSWIARRAPAVLTVSSFSAREATACFGVPRGRLHVTSEGWQHIERVAEDTSILDRHRLRGRPYVLAVSSPTPNKNFSAIVNALALMGPDAPLCVAAGSTMGSSLRPADLPGGLLAVGYVSDGELKALYRHAACFVFPSFYEGFGIPPLEAMANSCPVIASAAEAVRETCGVAALYFDPHDPGQLVDRLRELLVEPELAQRMRTAGLSRAARFSWRQAAIKAHAAVVVAAAAT